MNTEDVRDPDYMFGSLMDDNSRMVKWNRKKAEEFLAKANYLEDMASKYRELAAGLILEAKGFADDTAELLLAEFPLQNADGTEVEEE